METVSEFPTVTDDHFSLTATSVTISGVHLTAGMCLVKDGFVGSILAFECRNGALVLSVMELPRSALALPRKRRVPSHELFGPDGWQLHHDAELGRMKLRHGDGVLTLTCEAYRQSQAVQPVPAAAKADKPIAKAPPLRVMTRSCFPYDLVRPLMQALGIPGLPQEFTLMVKKGAPVEVICTYLPLRYPPAPATASVA